MSVVVEKLYEAPVSRVWRAITDNNEIKKWYFQLEDFKAETGFQFSFTGGPEEGPQYIHRCEITEVVPERKIAYSWRYDGYPGDSLVTWELHPHGDQTLVRIIHTGVESMAVNGPDFAESSFHGGWSYFLNDALFHFLQKKESHN